MNSPTATNHKMKLAVVTSYFPTAQEIYRGHSAFHTLRNMPEEASIQVFCPLASYPRAKWLNSRRFRYYPPDLNYQPPGLRTTYFTYPALPLVSRPFNGLTCAHHLKPLLVDYRPDLILSYSVYPEGFSALRIGQQLGVPVIVVSIGSDLRRIDFLTTLLVRYTVKRSAAVITVSEELRGRAIRLGVPPDRVITILNGFDASVFHPGDRAAARRELGLPADWELVLFTGSVTPEKGLAEFMDAIIALSATRPRLQVALIGEGGYTAEMKRYVAEKGHAERFRFLGRQTSAQVAAWMTACDIFCLPSHSEGCPNVVVEALATGRPVVATAVGGIPEMVDEKCGMLVPAKDTQKLQEAIDLALGRLWDQEQIAGLFQRGWKEVARETYEVCRRVIDHRAFGK